MLKKMIRRLIGEHLVYRFLFDEGIRENVCRKAFFYNAFKALAFNGIDGDYVEFGCNGAMTFSSAYRESRRHNHKAHLWGFDSFQGLPARQGVEDEHPRWNEGALSTSLARFHELCSAKGIPRTDYTVVPGFYDETLAKSATMDKPQNIALAYIDCDMYSSTKTVLKFLMPRIKHGMIIAFDDYFCWSPTQPAGERRAMLEVLDSNTQWNLVPYMQFSWGGVSFYVENKNYAKSMRPDRQMVLKK